MTRIRLLSDLHEEFAARVGGELSLPRVASEITVLAGDIHNGVGAVTVANRPVFAETDVILVPGNHEFYGGEMTSVIAQMRAAVEQANAARQAQGITKRIYLLVDQSVVIQQIRIIGATLWTDFELDGAEHRDTAMAMAGPRMVDYRLIQFSPDRALTAADTIHLHRTSRQFIETELAHAGEQGQTAVVITHHGPHPMSVHARFAGDPINPAFISNLEPLMLRPTAPQIWLHGHTHNSFDYRVGNTRVVANPAGYRRAAQQMPPNGTGQTLWSFENPRFDPELCIVVD